MSEFDAFREQWGELKFDPEQYRRRLDWRARQRRMPLRPPPQPQEGDGEDDQKFRRPSSAIACSARYRERYIMPEAIALLKAMTPIEAKETCVNVLKEFGFTVALRTAPGKKRDRSKEIAKRSAERAIARAEKAAMRAAERTPIL